MTIRLPFPLFPTSLRWLGVAAVAGTLVYFSLLTTPAAPPEPGPFWDKRLHFAGYLALGLSLVYATATRPDTRRRLIIAIGGAVLFGAAIELGQAPLPDRYFSVGDLLANAVGAVLAAGWFLLEARLEYVPIGDRTHSTGTP